MAEAKSTRRHTNFKDLSGQKFGKWTVLREAQYANGKVRWICRCACGGEHVIQSNHLTSGASGGCVSCSHRTHGMSMQSEYVIWQLMHQRCKNQNHKSRHRYGGRGISVCERWQSFEAFYADMGPRPTATHSIERRDNDGHYDPDNCYWATRKQQQRNRLGNRMLTFDGRTQCVAAWAEELGIHCNTLRERLRRGWSTERTLSEPAAK